MFEFEVRRLKIKEEQREPVVVLRRGPLQPVRRTRPEQCKVAGGKQASWTDRAAGGRRGQGCCREPFQPVGWLGLIPSQRAEPESP